MEHDDIARPGATVIRNSNGHRLRVITANPIGLAVCYCVTDLDDDKGRDDTFLIDRTKVRPYVSEEELHDRKTTSAGE